MDQSEELDHVAQPGGSMLSDLSAIPGDVSDYPSEDMDITAHLSELENTQAFPLQVRAPGLAMAIYMTLRGGQRKTR